MTNSVPFVLYITEYEKLHIFIFKKNVQEFSKYMCKIYEMRQDKIFI